MSEISVNSILDASGGATTTINGFTPTVSNMAGRNRIINGDMRIDQRNAGASVTLGVGGTYTIDRYRCYSEAASKLSIQQVTDAPSGFTNSMKATSLSAYTVGTNETFGVFQIIEGFNTADLAFGSASASSVTVSFWVKSSLTGTFGSSLTNSGFTRAYPFTYTISAANTWEQKSVSIAGDTTGTWLTNNGVGIGLFFGLGCGSGRSGTGNAWTGTSLVFAPTGATSVVGTSGATFYITGVQLEAGSVATPFEHRQYGQELALCQRYCEKSAEASEQFRLNKSRESTRTRSVSISFKVEKRGTPTVTLLGANGDGGGTPAAAVITSSAMRLNSEATADSQTPWVNGYLAESEL